MLGIPLRVVPSNVPEVRRPAETALDYVERLAREKALGVRGRLVLGADTTVIVRDEVLEKPVDEADALRMLRQAAGAHPPGGDLGGAGRRRADPSGHRRHQRRVPPDDAKTISAPTSATGEPMDKAGAYGIQGYGAALVERIEGDFFSVMGLPIRLVLRLMEEAGEPYEFGGSAPALTR